MKRKMRYASRDFSWQDLPTTRRAEFVFLWKNRRNTMFALSGLALLALLPLLLVMAFRMFNLAALEASWENANTSAEVVAQERARFTLAYNLFDVPCFAFLFLGFAAIFRIVRQLSFNEPVFFWMDAWQGIKKDGATFAFAGFVYGIVRFLCAWVNEMSSLYWLVRVLPFALAVDFFLPALLFLLTLHLTYQISWGEMFKGSFALFFHHAGYALLFAWGIAAWEAISLIPFFSVRLLALILEAILFLPSWSLGWMLFSLSCFDRDINPISCPADVRRGLYVASRETPRR